MVTRFIYYLHLMASTTSIYSIRKTGSHVQIFFTMLTMETTTIPALHVWCTNDYLCILQCLWEWDV